jgi:lipopolysaccharide assembly protein A
MRWIHLVVIVLFALAMLVFALQNLEVVTMSLLRFEVRAPLALVTIVAYLLGAVTGGSLFALLRRSYKGARMIGDGA